MRASRKYFFVACWLVILIPLSCAKVPSAKFMKNPYVEYVSGAKLVVHYNNEQNKTFYNFGDIHVKPQPFNGLSSEQGHSFDIGLMAESVGKYVRPDKITFDLTHNIAKKSIWHLPKNTSLIIEADGKRILDAKCKSDFDFSKETHEPCLQNGLQQDSPGEEYYDALFFDLPMAQVRQLSDARNVLVRIDKVSFNLTSEEIAALKRFSDIVEN
jgi:hypothetical protein